MYCGIDVVSWAVMFLCGDWGVMWRLEGRCAFYVTIGWGDEAIGRK